MCLTLYVGTQSEIAEQEIAGLTIESTPSWDEHLRQREQVRQWFSMPHICFVGAHTGCSCGFPHVVAEEPIHYWVGMFDDSEDRQNDRRSLQALLDLIRPHVLKSSVVELYPVWNGETHLSPKGTVRLSLDSIRADAFVFTERFLYQVTRISADRD